MAKVNVVNVSDITVTSIETITAFDILTGEFKWVLDELQNATISNAQETTDITGKQGRLLNTLKRNKSVTITGNNGLISGGLLSTQVGGTFENKETSVMFPDYLEVNGNTATSTYKAVGTAGNEIASVYIHNTDGTLGTVLTQGAEVAEGVFTYDPNTKELKFNEGDIADGTEISAYYFRKINGSVLDNMSDQYSEKVELYIDAFGEDKCTNVYRIQFHIPKADFNGNFDIEFGDNQSVHAFEARSLAGASCGHIGTGAATLWTYTVFGEDAPDVENP